MENVRNITQAYSQAPWRKQIQFIGIFLLFLVFLALIAGIYLSVTSQAATIGRDIQIMQVNIQELNREIANMETQLAVITSASVMEQRANEIGFVPIEKDQAIFILVPGYLPQKHAKIAPSPEPIQAVSASLAPDVSDSIYDWLQNNVLSSITQLMETVP